MPETKLEYIPGLDGVPATRSSISSLDGQKGLLAYRGKTIFSLIEHGVGFEECAHLLIHGGPSESETGALAAFAQGMCDHLRLPADVIKVLKALDPKAHPMEVLSIGVLALANHHNHHISLNTRDTGAEELETHMADQALIYLGGVAAIVAAWQRIRVGQEPLEPPGCSCFADCFMRMFTGADVVPESHSRFIDICLVLHAEHTLNASTFATMVTGSTLSNPGFVISTGVNTLAGPLHGGANERVIKMIDEIGSVENVEPWLDDALANKRIIWGMGHREYKTKDPRAKILEKLIKEQLGESGGIESDESFEIALELERLCHERLAHKGVYPNVDYYSGILYRRLGISTDQFTPLFAVSRTAGWLAHWMEQVRDNRIFRPTQIYTGPAIETSD